MQDASAARLRHRLAAALSPAGRAAAAGGRRERPRVCA